ncbi:MAG TPA: DUF2752 domain-containing protein [Pyrinomonadaceae bacterium]|jgi:hypothetical protein
MQEVLASFYSAAARRRAWLVLLGLSAVFVTSALWRPSDDGIILCPFRAITGYPCPGCGMTRAFSAIAHGELWRAVRYNPLSPLFFLAFVAIWAGAAATILNWPRVRTLVMRLQPSATATNVLLVIILAWWVVRLAVGI